MNVTPQQINDLAMATTNLLKAVKNAFRKRKEKKEQPLLTMITKLAERDLAQDPSDSLAQEAMKLVEDYRKENGIEQT